MNKATFVYLIGFFAGVSGMLAVAVTMLVLGLNAISLIASLLIAMIVWVCCGKAIGEFAK